ncbi:MAG: TolC family protein [Marinifilaceae bacterium]
MKKIFIPIYTCLGLAFSLNASAQENWSLTKCINHAYESNIQLKQSELSVKAAKNRAFQNKMNFLPTVSASASHTFNFGQGPVSNGTYESTKSQITAVSSFGVQSSLLLFNGFKKVNNYNKGKLSLQSKEKAVEKSKSDLAVNIAGLYLQVLYNTEILNIAREQLTISKEQEIKTGKLVEAGKLAEVELLKQKSLVSQDELATVEAENNLEMSYINIFQIMDVKEDNAFKVIILDDLIIDANRSLQSSSSLYNKALDLRPEIAKADIDIQVSEKDVSIARASMIPSLSLNAGVSSNYYDNQMIMAPDTKTNVLMSTGKVVSFGKQLDGNARKHVGLNLSIPIFNAFQASTSVRNSKIQLENTKLERENIKNVLRKEIQQVYASAKSSMKKYYSAKVAADYSKKSFEYSQKKYNAGLIDLVSYKEMKKDYVKSSSKFLQAKYDYVFRTKILDYYVGLPLAL